MPPKTINPEPGILAILARELAPDKPVFMLNLLLFKAEADNIDGKARTGRQSYAKYSKMAVNFVQGVGGEVVYHGSAASALIGPTTEQWDALLLVKYPSFSAFCEMLKNPDYQAITPYRTAALENSRLIPSQYPQDAA